MSDDKKVCHLVVVAPYSCSASDDDSVQGMEEELPEAMPELPPAEVRSGQCSVAGSDSSFKR